MDLQAFMGRLSGNPQKDVKQLANFVFMQNERMRYLLQNLDVTNFNDLGLARYENGRMQIYTEKLDIATKELTVTLEEEIEGVGKWVAELELTAQGLSSTVKDQETAIKNNTDDLNTIQNTTLPQMSSTIKQQADKIELVVGTKNGESYIDAAAITMAINNGDEFIHINADRIMMTGEVTFLSEQDVGEYGTTIIDAGRIQTGELVGVTLVSENSVSKVKIENGAIEFNWGGSIQNNALRDLVIDCDADLRIGSTGGGTVYMTSMGSTWALSENGWERVG